MGIKLKSCKCGGEGILADFEHRYNPKYKSIKFLKSGNGLKTWAFCKRCERYTESFRIPLDVINEWNENKMYNEEEWKEKLMKEYTGKVYLDEEIKNYILQTNWKTHGVEINFTNGDYERILFDKYDFEYIIYDLDIFNKDLNKVVYSFLDYLKKNNLKVKGMSYIRD